MAAWTRIAGRKFVPANILQTYFLGLQDEEHT
jgi:hypothetical protein